MLRKMALFRKLFMNFAFIVNVACFEVRPQEEKAMFKLLTSALVLMSSAALAAPVQFKIASEMKTLNIATVENRTDLENFTGRTSEVSGTLTFDAVAKTGSGTLTVNGNSIGTGIAMRDSHMKSKDWMNFAADPDIKFVALSVKNLSGNDYEVKGTLTMNGKSMPVTAKANVLFTKANEATKGIGLGGDALALTTKFQVKLSDYGVTHPSISSGRVGNILDVTVKAIATNK